MDQVESIDDAPKKQKSKKSSGKKRSTRRSLIVLALIVLLAIVFACGASGIFAFTPDPNSVDSRPRIIAAAVSPTPSNTPTATSTPTITPSPTETPIPTNTPIATDTPTSTPTNTPTPQPTADQFARVRGVPIIMYHYLSEPPPGSDVYRKDLSLPPDDFRDQLQWLKDNGYESISLSDLVYFLNLGWPELPEKPIILTFDDGYIDNYTNAFPILQEFDYTATFFILTDVTNREQDGYMTWDMYREMSEAGMDIQVHGREHLSMENQNDAWLLFHLRGPSETIEAELGYKPRFLAYPSGDYDENTIRMAQQEGYWAAVTTISGSTQDKSAIYELERLRIRNGIPLANFSTMIKEATWKP